MRTLFLTLLFLTSRPCAEGALAEGTRGWGDANRRVQADVEAAAAAVRAQQRVAATAAEGNLRRASALTEETRAWVGHKSADLVPFLGGG